MIRNKRVSDRIPRKIVQVTLLTAAFLVVLLGAGLAGADNVPANRRTEFYNNLSLLGEVYERIINNYVDEVDPHVILQAGIEGMLESLDEHSNYLPPVDYEDLMMSTEGEFGGLGISINIRDHFPTVVSPIEGTPAYYMGIQGGDQIIEIEGESSFDFTSREAVKLLRGTPGTKVNITIARPGVEDPLPYTITRDIITIESVPYAFIMEGVGYIRIQNFSRTTADELRSKLQELNTIGIKGLILDLRFNPGGLLESAKSVSELFLPRNKMIVSTKGRLRSQNQSFISESRGPIFDKVPIVVMINGSSASASEIVSAAIQDHDSGLVVGQTSFGKGSVQTVFRLDEDEALKLTTARYYTPSGRSIHKERNLAEESEEALAGEAMGQLQPTASEREVPRLEKEQFKTDAGRTVYGGGGITPDIEIEQDFLTDFEIAVERDGALFSFAIDYAAGHENIPEDYQVDDQVLAAFKDFLTDRENIDEYLGVFELSLSDSLMDANGEFLERGIRRELARRVYGPQAAYKVAIEADTQLHEALDLFRQATTLQELFALAAEWNEQHIKEMASQTASIDYEGDVPD